MARFHSHPPPTLSISPFFLLCLSSTHHDDFSITDCDSNPFPQDYSPPPPPVSCTDGSIYLVYGALCRTVKIFLMWNSKMLVDGGGDATVATSLLEASNLIVLKKFSIIRSHANLGVHGEGLPNLLGPGDGIEAQRLVLSLFYSIHAMADRITSMRQKLFDALRARGTPGDWSHIIKQIGMFTFTGLNPQQVAFMTKDYHIYMTSDGRISMAGPSSKTVPQLADAIHAAVTRVS